RKSGDVGITFVAAAGNEASDNDSVARYPANYMLPNVISVAAIDDRDALASFSNYGATTVDIGAPGVSVYSTLPNNSYGTYSGTSMATPHVTGVIGLLAAAKPGITVAEVRAAILDSAVPIASLAGKTLSGGRLNARAAIESLGMSVQASDPAVGSVVSVAPTSYTIDFSQNYSSSSVSASDFTVNAIPASSFVLVDANTIRFSFASNPVTAQGLQTMAIAAGAIARSSDSHGITAWSGSFFFDSIATAIASVTPANGSTISTVPTAITFVFNEPLSTSSIVASYLVLNAGSVTGVTVINSTTVQFGVNLSGVEGAVNYSIPKGTLLDASGSFNQAAITGSFTIDDPYLERYSATGLPSAIPDNNTIVSQSLVVSDSFVYSDINVQLDISHTWDSDLEATLIAPDGTAILLFSRNGSAGDNFTNTVFDSKAATLISAGVAPFTGRFQPLQSLAPLYNKSVQGTWQLQIRDLVSADAGTLNTFALIFTRVNAIPSLAAITDVSSAYGGSLV
ncbi:MAG: S8 family serine peptidase, partial [Planctomycetota bacterium]